jgi:hypothetical protein
VRAARPLIVTLAAVLLTAAPARAAWVQTNVSQVPTDYYQGITNDTGGHLFFDGPQHGGYRTDLALREQVRNPDLIPAEEPFNHIGDWSYDRAEGGRLILPLECYHPELGGDPNTCGTGAFGVADPNRLTWRYRVLLDPADIKKAMWAEVSPDGRLIWTQSGSDLLAYAAADVNIANAAAGSVIHPVARLAGAAAGPGITGAVFAGGRLFVATGNGTGLDVASIDLRSGARRPEIHLNDTGESEGLAYVDALGGALQWQIQASLFPNPTFGKGHGAVVSFVKRTDARLRVAAQALGRGRVRVSVTLRFLGADHPVGGASVGAGAKRAKTPSTGRATLRFATKGRHRITATKPPLLAGHKTVTVR